MNIHVLWTIVDQILICCSNVLQCVICPNDALLMVLIGFQMNLVSTIASSDFRRFV